MRDFWVSHMQAQAFPWVRKNLKSGKDEQTLIGLSLKPIELWEMTFPAECLNEVLLYNGIGGKEQVHDDKLKWLGKAFRKGMGLKPIPDYKKEGLKVWPRLLDAARQGMSIYGLGIKEDEYKEYPQWGYLQEGI